MLNKTKLIAASILIASTMATPVYAGSALERTTAKINYCKTEARAARMIMGWRQNGTPMGVVMERFVGIDSWLSMVRRAYAIPRDYTERARHAATIDFGNEVFRKCLEVYEDLVNPK